MLLDSKAGSLQFMVLGSTYGGGCVLETLLQISEVVARFNHHSRHDEHGRLVICHIRGARLVQEDRCAIQASYGRVRLVAKRRDLVRHRPVRSCLVHVEECRDPPRCRTEETVEDARGGGSLRQQRHFHIPVRVQVRARRVAQRRRRELVVERPHVEDV